MSADNWASKPRVQYSTLAVIVLDRQKALIGTNTGAFRPREQPLGPRREVIHPPNSDRQLFEGVFILGAVMLFPWPLAEALNIVPDRMRSSKKPMSGAASVLKIDVMSSLGEPDADKLETREPLALKDARLVVRAEII